MKVSGKRHIVDYLKEQHQLSERKACHLTNLHRASYRYQSQPANDQQLRARLKALAAKYSVYGYLMIHAMLKQEGLVINPKRTYRLYTEERLQVRTKRRKKLYRPRSQMTVPTRVNERWSMDFVSDQLASGRRFRVLNIVDDYSRECVGQLTDTSISGCRVARYLNELMSTRGKPKAVVCDNGPEFTSKAMFFWSKEQSIKINFIQPGKPTQNAFVESFNGKFRLACLNQHWFKSLADARAIIESWRSHYNNDRPHSSLNYLPPAKFAGRAA